MCEDCAAHSHEHDHDHSHEHDHDHSHDHGHDESALVETDGTVRIAVAGKGGVGKTTLAAAIADRLAGADDVIAIDADPDMNLAGALGVEEPPPVTQKRELIAERTGGGGGLVSLTPEVADVLETHSTGFGSGGRLVTIGAPAAGNTGCMCPENSFVRSLVAEALSADHVVMDMEAGVEHLGRGTASAVDAILVVVEPSRASIETAGRIRDLADDLGIDEVRAVVNRTRGEADADAVRDALDVPIVATLPYRDEIATAGLAGEPPLEASDQLRATADAIVSAFQPF